MTIQLQITKKLTELQRQVNALKARTFAEAQTTETVNVGGSVRSLQSAFDYILGLIDALTTRLTSLEGQFSALEALVIQVTTGENNAIKTITADYTPTRQDRTLLVDASGGAVIVTLPTGYTGQEYIVKKIDATANTVTLTPSTGLIDGSASLIILYQWTSRQVQTDGAAWFIL